MELSTLKLENFRNFPHQELQFNQHTAIIGRNGAGKSNLIEAIRLLSVGKSFKTNHWDEVVTFDQPYFRLQAQAKNQEQLTIELFYGQPFSESPKERRLTVDNQVTGWLDFFGRVPSVLFLPSDLELVTGSPQTRRRYLDGIFWQVDKQFRQDLLELTKVLAERSAILFLLKIGRAKRAELQPWTELLTTLTAKIQTNRAEYVTYLHDQLSNRASGLKPKMSLAARYLPNQTNPIEVADQEIKLTQNLVGPHRDELELLFNDRLARRFASRGQARLIVVLLKLIERSFISERSQVTPITLLDDMVSELDKPNSRQLFELFLDEGQVITTSVEPSDLLKDWQTITLG